MAFCGIYRLVDELRPVESRLKYFIIDLISESKLDAFNGGNDFDAVFY